MRRLGAIAAILALTSVAAPSAEASCTVPWVFVNAEHANHLEVYSYVVTPGIDPATSASASSVTEHIEGFFWALGFGNPAPGLGHDSGTLSGHGNQGWFVFYPGYSMSFVGSWASSNEIDGCISETPLPRGEVCMAMLFTDQHEGAGYFAALARKPVEESGHDYDFYLPDNAPFLLAAIPPPVVVTEQRIGPVETAVTVAPPLLDGGVYSQPECDEQAELPVGYRVYRQTLPAAAPPPDDRAVAAGWGWPTPPVVFGSEATLVVPCDDDRVTWLATTVVFDSGYETPVVSANSVPLDCRRCEAGVDADGDGSCTEIADGGPVDCDDGDPDVYPNAPQLCDGIENDCLSASWPAVPLDEADADADGFRLCAGDCAENDPARGPGMPEMCNGLDDDCDGMIDEDARGVDSDGDGVPSVCDNCSTLANADQADADLDGRGDACDPCTDRDGDGWGDPADPACPAGPVADCDDLDRLSLPGGTEYDDGRDNDCDGLVDEGLDVDGDGIPDFLDACPATPAGSGVDAAGCAICQAPALTPHDGRGRAESGTRSTDAPGRKR